MSLVYSRLSEHSLEDYKEFGERIGVSQCLRAGEARFDLHLTILAVHSSMMDTDTASQRNHEPRSDPSSPKVPEMLR